MKLELNFKVDEPNLNKRVYSKDVLEKAFDEALKKELFLLKDISSKSNESWNTIDQKDIIGKVDSYTIENNSVFIEAVVYDEEIKELLNSSKTYVTTAGIAEVDAGENGITIIKKDFKLLSCFLTNDVKKSK